MWYQTAPWSWMAFHGVLMLLIPVLIVGGIAAVIFALAGGSVHGAPRVATPSALETLKERYAKGEIQRNEYLQKKADLGG